MSVNIRLQEICIDQHQTFSRSEIPGYSGFFVSAAGNRRTSMYSVSEIGKKRTLMIHQSKHLVSNKLSSYLIERLQEPGCVNMKIRAFPPSLPCGKCATKQLVSTRRLDWINSCDRTSDADSALNQDKFRVYLKTNGKRYTRCECSRGIHFLPNQPASWVNLAKTYY